MNDAAIRLGHLLRKRRMMVLLLTCTAACLVGSMLVARSRSTASETITPIATQMSTNGLARTPTAWDRLSEGQRAALLPLEVLWTSLDKPEQRRWLEVASRMEHLSPEAAKRARMRMTEWAKLSPKLRSEARLRYVTARRKLAGKGNEQWKKYQLEPKLTVAHRPLDRHFSMVAPAIVNASPGATTVLLNQFHDATANRRPTSAVSADPG